MTPAEARVALRQVIREASRDAEARRAVIDAGVLGCVPPGDPARPLVQALYRLHDEGAPADAMTLRAAVLHLPPTEGRDLASAELDEADALPHSSDVRWWIDALRTHALKTRTAEDLANLATASANGTDPGEVIERLDGIKARILAEGKPAARRLSPVKLSDYDPAAKVPILAGDPDGEALIAADDLTLFCGEVGGGKSLSLADLGLAAAFGRPFVGHPINGPLRVMLVLADGDGERPTQRRLYRLAVGRGLSPKDVDDCGRFRLYVPAGFNLDALADLAELRRELDDFDPDVLCIESLSSLAGPTRGGLMYADQAADFAATRLRPLQTRPDGTRRAVVCGHHLTKPRQEKGGGRAKDRTGGSFYVLGAVDAALGFEIAGPESFKLRAVKRSRWGCSFAPFLVTITGQKDEPLLLKNCGPLQESEAKRDKAEGDVMTAVAALDGPEGYIKVADAYARLGAKRDSAEEKAAQRAIARLVKAGYLERGKRGTVRIVTRPAEGDE